MDRDIEEGKTNIIIKIFIVTTFYDSFIALFKDFVEEY